MPRVVRDPITWLTYGQLAAYGYFLYTVSPAIALLRDEQHVSSSVASLHGVAVAVGALIAGAGFPWFARRVGRGHAMWVGLAGMAAGIAGLCVFRPIAATVACTLVAATAGVALVAGVVATLGERHGTGGATVIAEANALAVAVGALAPLAIGASVAAGWTWRPAAAVLVVMCLGCAVVARVRGIRLPDGPDARARRSGSAGIRARDEVAGELSLPAGAGTRGSGRLPAGFWIAWALTSVTGSVEVSLNLWSGDVLRQHDGMSSGAAATAVSAILAGMFLGRVAGGRIALRVPAPRLLLAMLGVSLVGFAVFWTSPQPTLAVGGLAIMGFGNGMHYPLGISMALRAAPGQEDLAAARASYNMAIAFGVAPWVLGTVADHAGARTAFLLVPAMLVGAAALVPPLARRLPRPAPAAPDQPPTPVSAATN